MAGEHEVSKGTLRSDSFFSTTVVLSWYLAYAVRRLVRYEPRPTKERTARYQMRDVSRFASLNLLLSPRCLEKSLIDWVLSFASLSVSLRDIPSGKFRQEKSARRKNRARLRNREASLAEEGPILVGWAVQLLGGSLRLCSCRSC